MGVFSVTEMADKEACRRRWFKGSLNGQSQEQWLPAKPLILGTLVHAVLADWSVAWHHGDHSLAFPLTNWDKHAAAAEAAIRVRYAQKYHAGGPISDEEMDLDLERAKAAGTVMTSASGMDEEMNPQQWDVLYGEPVMNLGRAMIKNYVEFYEEPYPSKSYELVEVEQTITVPVFGTEHCIKPGKPRGGTYSPTCVCSGCKCATEAGCLDHAGKRRRSNCSTGAGGHGPGCCVEPHYLEGTFDQLLADKKDRLVIPDHKTYEKRPTETDNAQNDQFLRYQWIVAQALPDRQVVGTLYNGMWKRYFPVLSPTTGKPLKSQATGEPYTLDELFYRDLIPHDDEEIAEIGYHLPAEIRDMEAALRDPHLRWPHRSWSTCPNCGMQDECLAMSRGENTDDFAVDFTKRERSPAWKAVE